MNRARGGLSGAGGPVDLDRPIWEREMKRLRVLTRLFATITLALIARLLKTGLSTSGVAAAGLVGALFLGSLWLSHLGHRIEPDPLKRDGDAG